MELEYVEQIAGKDKREKRMQLTSLGRSIYEQVRVTIDQFEEDCLKGISEEEQQDIIQIMERVRSEKQPDKVRRWSYEAIELKIMDERLCNRISG